MDMGKPSSGAKSAVPEFTTNRLVVPVDVMKDTLPHYTLLELSDVGMKLANSEVSLLKAGVGLPLGSRQPDHGWHCQ